MHPSPKYYHISIYVSINITKRPRCINLYSFTGRRDTALRGALPPHIPQLTTLPKFETIEILWGWLWNIKLRSQARHYKVSRSQSPWLILAIAFGIYFWVHRLNLGLAICSKTVVYETYSYHAQYAIDNIHGNHKIVWLRRLAFRLDRLGYPLDQNFIL